MLFCNSGYQRSLSFLSYLLVQMSQKAYVDVLHYATVLAAKQTRKTATKLVAGNSKAWLMLSGSVCSYLSVCDKRVFQISSVTK